MGTKNNPTPNDCYAKAEPDEPIFVLLARDPQAPQRVRDWAMFAAEDEGNLEKVREAMLCAEEMEQWRAIHRPGTTPDDIAQSVAFLSVNLKKLEPGLAFHVGTILSAMGALDDETEKAKVELDTAHAADVEHYTT